MAHIVRHFFACVKRLYCVTFSPSSSATAADTRLFCTDNTLLLADGPLPHHHRIPARRDSALSISALSLPA
jgi:hypothetical protein